MEHDVTTLVANILIGIGLGIGLVVFWIWHTVRKFEGEMRGIVREAIQEVEAQMLGVVVEEDDGQLYFYRETDRQFLCQGTSLAEVRKRFNELYPEKIAFLAGGDPALIERLKAELAEIKKQETNESSVKV
jgi:MFS superfamily sulfate permease-like transporter